MSPNAPDQITMYPEGKRKINDTRIKPLSLSPSSSSLPLSPNRSSSRLASAVSTWSKLSRRAPARAGSSHSLAPRRTEPLWRQHAAVSLCALSPPPLAASLSRALAFSSPGNYLVWPRAQLAMNFALSRKKGPTSESRDFLFWGTIERAEGKTAFRGAQA